ncbi:protein phosphatase inhibitor 2-like [Durio zibethinus]|uniref:Protein phosphatase inhibitor 2-like n=1 Tax=Durio zibethinus TaxID=66656 RepID=A0A6P5YD01_DURZI|nr:protein phosphatase inhibitor 2-like [Durio zibethinus]
MGIKSSHYQHKKMKGRVRWDEANLSEIEANKPVRKKIDEPKTPYPPMIEEDGSSSTRPDNSVKSIGYSAHAEALRNALNKLALSEKNNGASGGWTSSDEEGETGDEDQGFAKQRDAVSFEDRRRAHYDEFKKVKEMQEKACFLDDEHDNGKHNSGSCSNLSIDSREIDIEDDDQILPIIYIENNDDQSFTQ